MAHRLLTPLVALALLASPVVLAEPSSDPFDVVVHPGSRDAYPGDSLRANVTLTANVSVTATLNITFVSPGLTARLDRTTLNASAGNSTNTTLRVSVSSNATPGTRYVEFTTTQSNGTHVETDVFIVHVHETPIEPQAHLSLSPGYVEVDAGETANLTLTCSANVDVTLWLSHNLPPAGWNVTLSQYHCTVHGGANGTVAVQVRTPASGGNTTNATQEWTLNLHGHGGGLHANDSATIAVRPPPPPPLFETRTCVLGSCVTATVPRPGAL